VTPAARLLPLAVAVAAINVPFGYWRAGVRRYSGSWFLAIHVPVPFVVALRLLAGIAWRLATFPVLVGAFFAGQFVGARLRKWSERRRGVTR